MAYILAYKMILGGCSPRKIDSLEYSIIMPCEFCLNDTETSVWKSSRGREWNRCTPCAQVSKKCKKGAGIYYSVGDSCYLTGEELAAHYADEAERHVLLDLHGVTDLFTPEEFKEIMSVVPEGTVVKILSFVGSTTQTRVDAHHQILEYGVPGYLCFARKDTAGAGSKGGFIVATGVADALVFADDSEDHVASAKDAGAKDVLHVHKGIAEHQRKAALRKFILGK